MTSAAIYLRISLDALGEGLGVSRQREDCVRHCQAQGWEVREEHIFEDNDISAYKSRPRYQAMLEAVQAGQVDVIVAWQPDRLYRRATDLEKLVEIIETHKVMVSTVKAGDLNLDSAYGRMVARMLSVIAMGEGELKSERWRRSWRQGRESGAPAKTGSRLYGYTRDGQIIEAEAVIARGMAKDIISGTPILTVSNRLEAEGILTTRGSVWRPGTVRQYLANPRIAGYSTLAGEIVADGTWEPILDRDTWETVRALLTSRARGTFPRTSVLNGLIYCGGCGHRMVTSSTRGRRTYRCPKRPGMPGCGAVSGFADPIEEVVETVARERLADPRVQRRVAELRSAVGGGALVAEINALEGRLRELEAELDVPGVPVSRISRAIERTTERLAECQRRLADAATATAPALNTGGADWPAGLAERRALIAVALTGHKIYLDPAMPGNKFDPQRVRLEV